MHLDTLLTRTDCIPCPDPPPCNCEAETQDCFQINRDCNTCSTFKCVDKPGISSSKGGGGVSKGALAGAIIGSLIFCAIAIFALHRYRRYGRISKLKTTGVERKIDVPAPAATVLSRPDPTEKSSPSPTELNTVRVYPTSSNTTMDLDPNLQNGLPHSQQLLPPGPLHNPFDDSNSIQTAGTEGTNVIPIALVTADRQPARHSQGSSTLASPVRPVRSPDLNLNLEHVNVSRDSVRGGGYARSQASGISRVSSRNSYMSNASYSSDFLNEAPMIITPTKAAVRQVVGVVKAEVINAPGSHNSSDDLRVPSIKTKPATSSPLSASSFGPSDVVDEADETSSISSQGNPFSDEHSAPGSASHSVTTFGQASPRIDAEIDSQWVLDEPNLPWSRTGERSRPSSMSTQAGSVIDISSATRVNVGLSGLRAEYAVASPSLSPDAIPRSPYRTTMGRLVSPPNTGSTLEEQQQRALAHAQARAQAQGLGRRVSGSSVVSATSTRADSILESFPFVPPSPISDRPLRSPPCSPSAQQFQNPPSSPLAQQSFINPAVSKAPSQTSEESPLPPPPDRRTLGFSTGSQLSTASSGLGSFPFQIDSGSSMDVNNAHVIPPQSRQRASLDTLALTSDLSSYPLEFESNRSLTHKST